MPSSHLNQTAKKCMLPRAAHVEHAVRSSEFWEEMQRMMQAVLKDPLSRDPSLPLTMPRESQQVLWVVSLIHDMVWELLGVEMWQLFWEALMDVVRRMSSQHNYQGQSLWCWWLIHRLRSHVVRIDIDAHSNHPTSRGDPRTVASVSTSVLGLLHSVEADILDHWFNTVQTQLQIYIPTVVKVCDEIDMGIVPDRSMRKFPYVLDDFLVALSHLRETCATFGLNRAWCQCAFSVIYRQIDSSATANLLSASQIPSSSVLQQLTVNSLRLRDWYAQIIAPIMLEHTKLTSPLVRFDHAILACNHLQDNQLAAESLRAECWSLNDVEFTQLQRLHRRQQNVSTSRSPSLPSGWVSDVVGCPTIQTVWSLHPPMNEHSHWRGVSEDLPDGEGEGRGGVGMSQDLSYGQEQQCCRDCVIAILPSFLAPTDLPVIWQLVNTKACSHFL